MQWDAEEYEHLLEQVTFGNPQNHILTYDAWKRYHPNHCNAALLIEKLKTAASAIPNERYAARLRNTILTTSENIHISASTEEQCRQLHELLVLAYRMVERYPDPFSEKQFERCRLKICGPASKQEAERLYRLNSFHSPCFQTDKAKKCYASFADRAQEILWDQEYFEELTAKEVRLDRLEFPDVYAIFSRVYSRENAERLYQKFSDFRNCLSEERGHMRAEEISSRVTYSLWEHEDYDLVERFLSLAEDLLAYDPRAKYLGQQAERNIKKKKYRERLEEVHT